MMLDPVPSPAAAPSGSPPGSPYRPVPLGPKIRIWPPVVLAPMAGVTSYPYRRICREQGAGLCVSEMISSHGVLEGGAKTWKLAWFGEDERPRSIQIFGCDPGHMGEASRILRGELDIDHVDINFGCPVRKVTRKGMGAAAFLDPLNAARVVRAVVRAVAPVPVTIKVRVGLDDERITFRDAGRVAEEEGCAYIALHGRTAKAMYSGKARWDLIGELKERVRIPVLGNGDIFTAADGLRMMAETGCDGVVIGRGCLGNPWLFRNLERLFNRTGEPELPAVEEIVAVIREHHRLLVRHHADFPRLALLELRKFGPWYLRGLRGCARLRPEFQRIETEDDVARILDRILATGYQEGVDPGKPTRG
jgi:nifR3 family TIM-barrel protein